MSEVAINVENISKRYIIGNQTSGSFRDSLASLLSFGKKGVAASKEEFWALNDVSFEIKKGDAVGIIGRNGAGKSTLLKILSQITEPTKGRIEIAGRVASLLEVGTGFHPELTGRENIFLNGTILGMTRQEVRAKFDEIVAFSGVEKFIDTPVKRYSSGMYVRLAFAVAAHLEPEILIIDEVLAVGDADFQKKCMGKMGQVAKDGRTVLFVSHNMQAVTTLCNTAIMLESGRKKIVGSPSEVISYYYSQNFGESKIWEGNEGDDNARLLRTEIKATNGEAFLTTNEIEVLIQFEVIQPITNLVLGFHLISEYGYELAYTVYGDYIDNPSSITEAGKYTCKFVIPADSLTKGNYTIRIDFGIHDVKFITQEVGDLKFYVGSTSNRGCRYPVRDVKGYASLFRPNWAREIIKE